MFVQKMRAYNVDEIDGSRRIQAVDGNIINLLNPLSNSALHRGPIC
jgi:hypothetical protein